MCISVLEQCSEYCISPGFHFVFVSNVSCIHILQEEINDDSDNVRFEYFLFSFV